MIVDPEPFWKIGPGARLLSPHAIRVFQQNQPEAVSPAANSKDSSWPPRPAAGRPIDSPEAGGRSYAQVYKDMVLALCVATAYQKEPGAAADAGSTFSALREWTNYDLENSPDEIKALVDSYLARNDRNLLVEPEVKGVRFDLLKCLDLYHGQELEAQVKRFVIKPKRSFRQDNPRSAR